MVQHALIIFESEVSITVICQLCSPCYTEEQTNNCTKSTFIIKLITMKNVKGAAHPNY